jgi:squalene synthase HpnC
VVSAPLDRAYASCVALAASHYENFPVASRLLPAPMRPHIAAVYAFARVADDIADEGGDAPHVRRVRLAAWQQRLHDAVRGPRESSNPSGDDLILIAAANSIRELDLPLPLFDDLLSAFAQDTTTTRYESWADLLDYCRRSANPIGRLVLRIGGYRDAALDRSSDAMCTALQLANFWQDLGRDWRGGRLYVPREVYEATGASLDDVAAGHLTAAWADALARCITRTRECFAQGRHVCDGVRGRLKLELRFTWLGGVRILDRVEQQRARLLTHRPTLSARDVPSLVWQAARWEPVAA